MHRRCSCIYTIVPLFHVSGIDCRFLIWFTISIIGPISHFLSSLYPPWYSVAPVRFSVPMILSSMSTTCSVYYWLGHVSLSGSSSIILARIACVRAISRFPRTCVLSFSHSWSCICSILGRRGILSFLIHSTAPSPHRRSVSRMPLQSDPSFALWIFSCTSSCA